MRTENETLVGYVCATAICITALACDGITALTASMAVASAIAGVGGYTAGRYRKLKNG